MSESVDSVKAVALYLRDVADRNAQRPDVAQRVLDHAGALDAVAERLMALEALTSALPPDLGNILDLPQELRNELSVAKTDELEDQIVTVINAYGGEASLDQVLVGLYRKFKVIQKRRFVQNKLYRMEMVWSVEGRKGVYTTQEQVSPLSGETIREYANRIGDAEDTEIPF
ncbi:hypothetical protein [Marivivens marinus]|uniref:hypothetical protein n=1 Tax=Marivivens marinus TaxID=3110173 RepID=UPI003B84B21B